MIPPPVIAYQVTVLGSPPMPATCSADTNGDDRVNVDDLINVIAQWGDCE